MKARFFNRAFRTLIDEEKVEIELTIKLTTQQVIDFIQQIPLEDKLAVLTTLAEQAHDEHAEQIKYGEGKMRQICTVRGLDWDGMTEEERIDFINDIVHEDRECNQ